MYPVRLVGEKVVLREFRADDENALLDVIGDDRVTVWLSHDSRSREEVRAMVAGIVLFRERVDRWGVLAMALAAVGVLLQAVAIGHPPWIALTLGLAFTAYGVIRKQVDADAQTGLFVECLLMAGPGLAYVVWLYHSGAGLFGHSVGGTLLISLAGPATVAPLALFAWSARRLPLSSLGFMQFIGPTMGFITGLAVGEPLGPLRALSFAFIWGGALTFAFGAWRAGRRLRAARPQSAA